MPSRKTEGARSGALSGGIAGTFVLIGQVIGEICGLVLAQVSGIPRRFDGLSLSAPSLSADVFDQAFYYSCGLGSALCCGLADIAVATLAGAVAGYLGTSEQPVLTDVGHTVG
jgi:hypothetical protein